MGKRADRQSVQPDDSDALCFLAAAARQAPRFLEQSRPTRGKWAGYLLVVHDRLGIPGPRTVASTPGPSHQSPDRRHPVAAALGVCHPLSGAVRRGWRRERRGVYLTNLALAVFIGGLGICLGYARVAAVQLPIMVIASIVGVWLFSIQHRFEYAQWMPDASWRCSEAALG